MKHKCGKSIVALSLLCFSLIFYLGLFYGLFFFVRSLIPTCGGIIVSIILSSLGQCYYPFTTLVLQSSTMIFIIESLLCYHFHILVGIINYRTWLVYSNDGLPQNALGLREQASWMHTHLVSSFELSYTYNSSASVAWQSLPTHINIY